MSTSTIEYCVDLLRRHLAKIGSRWRLLPAGRIVILALAHLRNDERVADLAGGNDISPSTIGRWVEELIDLLAAHAPRLDRALRQVAAAGGTAVLLDGTLVRTRRRSGRQNRRNYNGKHKAHGLLFLALTDESGNLIWISAAHRGAASEITSARHDHITAHLRAAGLGAIADLGFVGLDDDVDDPVIITGFKAARKKKLTAAQKQANQLIAATRAPNEHGFAALKTFRILGRMRRNPAKATSLLRALLVLTRLEYPR